MPLVTIRPAPTVRTAIVRLVMKRTLVVRGDLPMPLSVVAAAARQRSAEMIGTSPSSRCRLGAIGQRDEPLGTGKVWLDADTGELLGELSSRLRCDEHGPAGGGEGLQLVGPFCGRSAGRDADAGAVGDDQIVECGGDRHGNGRWLDEATGRTLTQVIRASVQR